MTYHLTKNATRVIDRAAELAGQMQHEYYTAEHILRALLDTTEIDDALKALAIDTEHMLTAVDNYLLVDLGIKSPVNPDIQLCYPSNAAQRIIERAPHIAHETGYGLAETSHLLLSMFGEKESWAVYILQQHGIDLAGLRSQLFPQTAFDENALFPTASAMSATDKPATAAAGIEPQSAQTQDPIAAFCTDITRLAKAGKITPMIGREREIDDILNTLCRRTKNNPLLVGEPGVGKTAIAEGLACRIVAGDVPPLFANRRLLSLDLGGMLAGTRYRGDFEERVKAIIAAVEARNDILLFIDEIHMLVGSGAASGAMDAANLLKPALARGSLHCLGATTFAEYRKHFEKDSSLTRRFQKIDILEPSPEETLRILKGLKPTFEKHHIVVYSDEALQAAVDLSIRHLVHQFLPDKAIDLIDGAGATAALACRSVIDVEHIEAQVAKVARIPPKEVGMNETNSLRTLESDLKSVIFDQDPAISQVVKAIQVSRAGLREGNKPVGNYLFNGPTGSGKTELAKQLAAHLSIPLIRFDMSEYAERHTVARLIGAPAGYVGFDQGGLLTTAVDKQPRCVLLFDEIEKAHPDVFNVMLQIMDDARQTDNTGKTVDFRNVILIFTSNAGAADSIKPGMGFNRDLEGDPEKMGLAVKALFQPEFINRLDAIVQFGPISPKTMVCIVDKFVGDLSRQLAERKISISITDETREKLAALGYDKHNGARPLARVIHAEIKQPLASEILFGKLTKGGSVTISVENDAFHFDIREPVPLDDFLPEPSAVD